MKSKKRFFSLIALLLTVTMTLQNVTVSAMADGKRTVAGNDLTQTVSLDEEPVDATESAEESKTYKASYSDDLYVEAIVPAGAFEVPVTLVAEMLSEDSDAYKEAIASLEKAGKTDEAASYTALDIRFVDEEGNEVEPNKDAGSIQISLKAVEETSTDDSSASFEIEGKASKTSEEKVDVYHITDEGKVETVAEGTEEGGEVVAEFEVSEFSTFVVSKLVDKVTKDTYSTLADAIKNAADGATIKVTDGGNITESSITINKNITLDLNGKTLQTAKNVSWAYSFVVEKSLTIMDSSADQKGTIKGTTSEGGMFGVKAGATLTLESGTLTGQNNTLSRDTGGSNPTIMRGGAVSLMGEEGKEANFIMTGGTISDCSVKSIYRGNDSYPDGKDGSGAAVIAAHGKITISGGTISNCTSAKSGGAIYLADVSTITMTGGTITGCTAGEEGGALALGYGGVCTGTITGGKFTYNETKTSNNWGGGAIFICADAKMTIKNAYIVDNYAEGFGGGIASCPTGDTTANSSEAYAVFDNKAGGNAYAKQSSKVLDQDALAAVQAKKFTVYQDFYTPGGKSGCGISGTMIGYGDQNWTASTMVVNKDTKGNITSYDVKDFTVTKGQLVTAPASRQLGMRANPSKEDKDKAYKDATVFITNNKSNVHGGGILNNGELILGAEKSYVEYPPVEFEMEKKTSGVDPETGTTLSPEGFEFEIRTENNTLVKTVKSDANGDIKFDITYEEFGSNFGSKTFIITEKAGTKSYINYDSSKRRLKLTISEKKDEIIDGNYTITKYTLETSGLTWEQSDDGGNTWKAVTGTPAFTNTVKSGNLKLSKIVDGYSGTAKAYKFEVKYSKDKWVKSDGTFSDKQVFIDVTPGSDVTINNLPIGNYTVSEDESDAAITNYSLVVTGGGTATVVEGKTKDASITNTYTPDTGKLVLKKKVEGYTGTAKTYKFEVKNSSNKWIKFDGTTSDSQVFIDVKEGSPVTISNLPVGTYTVSEDSTTSQINSYSLVVTGDGQKSVTKGGTTNVEITNTYTELKGNLKISKAVSGYTGNDTTYKFEVKNSEGKWITKDGAISDSQVFIDVVVGTDKEIKNLPVDTYTVIEDKANAKRTNYSLSVTGNGTVTAKVENGKTADAKFTNTYTKKSSISINKMDIKGDTELVGAKLELYDSKNNLVSDWVSKKDEVWVVYEDDLTVGETYTLKETTAAPGYNAITSEIKFTIDKDYKITVTSGTQGEYALATDGTLLVKDEPKTIKINKYDIKGDTELVGAKLSLEDAKNNEISNWTSKKDEVWEIDVNKLTVGDTYTLKETTAAPGYNAITSEIKFTIDKDYKITVTSGTQGEYALATDGTLLVKDEPKTIKINKYDIKGDTELAGAKLSLVDASNNEISNWTSKKDEVWEIDVNKLTVGAVYTLKETTAAPGYNKITSEIKFTIDKDYKITVTSGTQGEYALATDGTLLVKDEPKTIKINKYDIKGDTELVGAKLSLVDAKNNEISSWTSKKDEVWEIDVNKLTVGDTYTLKETTAAPGYNAITSEIKFTIDKDYKITVTSGTQGEYALATDGTLLVKDEPKTIKINKYNIKGDTELVGAKLSLVDASNNEISSWTSKKDEVWEIDVNKLTVGDTYTLKETTAAPGYNAITSEIKFTIDKDYKITVTSGTQGEYALATDGTLLVKDEPKTIKINKYDIKGDTELEGAVLKLEDASGNEISSWKSKKNEIWEVDVNKLKVGETYTLKETTAPTNYNKITTDIQFTIDKDYKITVTSGTKGESEVTKEGILMVKDAPETIKINKVNIKGTAELPDAVLELYNSNGTKVDEWKSVVGKTWEVDVNKLTVGEEYTLKETTAPANYNKITTDIKFTIDKDHKITITSGTQGESEVTKEGILLVKDAPKMAELVISKTDLGGNEVDKAALKISGSEKDGTKINDIIWESKKGEPKAVNLKVGTYVLEETAAPNGYVAITKVEFTVNDDGTVTVDKTTTTGKVEFKDDGTVRVMDDALPVELKFRKTDITGSTEVEKASLKITGEEVDGTKITAIEWESEKNNDKVVKLKPGKYELTEDAAPNGYQAITTVEFEVKADGTIDIKKTTTTGIVEVKDGVVIIKDDNEFIDFTFKKRDIAGTGEVIGAKLNITGTETGKTDQISKIEWTTVKGQDKDVKLRPGEYVLHEETAPNPYVAISDVKFTVNKDGSITVTEQSTTGLVEYNNGVVTIKDDYKGVEVNISKVDVLGKEIEGAKLTVTGTQSGTNTEINPIEWTSKENETKKLNLQPGTYKLHEVSAPSGYEVITDVEFTVAADGKVTVTNTMTSGDVVVNGNTLVITDDYKPTTLKFKKTDITGSNEVEKASLKITGTENDGTKITAIEWESEKNNDKVVKLKPGKYELTEDAAPNGYQAITTVEFEVKADGTIDITKTTTTGIVEIVDGVVIIKDDNEFIDYTFKKRDIAGTGEVIGAKLNITGTETGKKDQISKIEWTTVKGQDQTVKLRPGEYVLHEETAPNPYVAISDVEFTVNKDGSITVTKQSTTGSVEYVNGEVIIKDDYQATPVTFSKVDILGDEIDGAKLKLTGTEKDGTKINPIEWTSKKGDIFTFDLKPGEYKLHEDAAPNGYAVITEAEFTVDENGKITMTNTMTSGDVVVNGTTVIITDDYKPTTVTFKKTDIVGNEVENASLKITGTEKGSTTPITAIEWKSEKGKEKIVDLNPGEYTLTEVAAPNGYVAITEVKFTVNVDNTITVTQTTTTGNVEVNDKNEVIITDDFIDHTVTIRKTDVAGQELKGAKLTVTGFLKNSKVAVTPIEWTSDGTAKTITVKPGTYTLTETSAPKGYAVSESITFDVDFDDNGNTVITIKGDAVNEVVMVDGYADHNVNIRKTDIAGNEVIGATLKITDKDGNVVDGWTSNGTTHVSVLQPGTYTLTETRAPKGYLIAESITFSVDFDDNGETIITIKGDEVSEVVMVDADDPNDDDEYDDNNDKEDEGERNDVSGNTGTDTGDHSNLILWITLFFASILSGAVIFFVKRRNEELN